MCSNETKKAIVCLLSDSDGLKERIDVLDPAAYVLTRDRSAHALVTVCKSILDPKTGFPDGSISENCRYRSESFNYQTVGSERIMRHLKWVVEANPTFDVRYELARTADVLREGRAFPPECNGSWCAKIFADECLESVLFVQTDENEQISNIFLSCDGHYLKDFPESAANAFYSEGCLNARTFLEQKYGNTDTLGKMRTDSAPGSEEIWNWKTADQYARHVLREPIEQDFLGEKYICYYSSFEGEPCALYLLLQKDTILYDISESFAWLRDDPISKGRRILILYVHAVNNGYGEYVIRHCLDGRHDPELWTLETVGGRELLMYASEMWKKTLMDRFGAAFNAKDYGLICTLSSPEARKRAFASIWLGVGMDDPYEFFDALSLVNGPLSPGYVRTDRTAFRKVLCSGNKLYILLGYDENGKINAIDTWQQDESYHELIVLDEACPPHPLNEYPRLAAIQFLPPSENARFCMRLVFDNGEEKLRRFECTGENDEIALIEGYCFTNRIFQNGKLVESDEGTAKNESRTGFFHGQRVEFANGFSVTTAELYFNSRET